MSERDTHSAIEDRMPGELREAIFDDHWQDEWNQGSSYTSADSLRAAITKGYEAGVRAARDKRSTARDTAGVAVSAPPGVTVTVSYDAPKWLEARITRVDRLGVGFVETTGTAVKQYAFTFDRIIGYRGESLKEAGLCEGRIVWILVQDEKVEKLSRDGIPSSTPSATATTRGKP